MSDTVEVLASDVAVVNEVLMIAAKAFGSTLGVVPGFGAALEACGRMSVAAAQAQMPEDPVTDSKAMAIAYSELLRTYLEADFERHEAFRLVEIQAQTGAQLSLMRLMHGG